MCTLCRFPVIRLPLFPKWLVICRNRTLFILLLLYLYWLLVKYLRVLPSNHKYFHPLFTSAWFIPPAFMAYESWKCQCCRQRIPKPHISSCRNPSGLAVSVRGGNLCTEAAPSYKSIDCNRSEHHIHHDFSFSCLQNGKSHDCFIIQAAILLDCRISKSVRRQRLVDSVYAGRSSSSICTA